MPAAADGVAEPQANNNANATTAKPKNPPPLASTPPAVVVADGHDKTKQENTVMPASEWNVWKRAWFFVSNLGSYSLTEVFYILPLLAFLLGRLIPANQRDPIFTWVDGACRSVFYRLYGGYEFVEQAAPDGPVGPVTTLQLRAFPLPFSSLHAHVLLSWFEQQKQLHGVSDCGASQVTSIGSMQTPVHQEPSKYSFVGYMGMRLMRRFFGPQPDMTFLQGFPGSAELTAVRARSLAFFASLAYEDWPVARDIVTNRLREFLGTDAEWCAGFTFQELRRSTAHSDTQVLGGVTQLGSGELGTEAYVIKIGDSVVVGFRGSEVWKLIDWFVDFDAWPMDTDHGRTHPGFLNALGLDRHLDSALGATTKYRALRAGDPEESEHTENVTPFQLLLTEVQKAKGAKIFVTGHSLGGALAAIFTAALTDRSKRKDLSDRFGALYTYAAPRIGDFNMVTCFTRVTVCTPQDGTRDLSMKQPKVVRFVNTNDIVPRVPPPIAEVYNHYGVCVYIQSRRERTFLDARKILRRTFADYVESILSGVANNSAETAETGVCREKLYCALVLEQPPLFFFKTYFDGWSKVWDAFRYNLQELVLLYAPQHWKAQPSVKKFLKVIPAIQDSWVRWLFRSFSAIFGGWLNAVNDHLICDYMDALLNIEESSFLSLPPTELVAADKTSARSLA
eukprot:jgi/Chlat1/977/Chrsp108S01396